MRGFIYWALGSMAVTAAVALILTIARAIAALIEHIIRRIKHRT